MYQPPSEQNPNQPPPGYTPPPGYAPPSQPYGTPPPGYSAPYSPPPLYGAQQPPPPGYAPPGYAPPGYAPPGYAAPMGQQSNNLAIASLVLGLCVLIAGILTGIPAVITGHMALNRINQNPMLGGKGMAITGLVFGYLSILGTLCLVGLIIASAANGSSISTTP